MYKVQEVRIDGFWYRLNAHCSFNDNVNIIIGRNGTGKTTFMNILHAALSVDLDGLIENDFKIIEIKLIFQKKQRVIKAKKIEIEEYPFPYIEYQISNKKYTIKAIPQDNRNIPSHYRKRALEESVEVRNELNKLVSLTSLSVYRLRGSEDLEIKDRMGKRIISPVDYRLSQLKMALTQYQFELSQKAQIVSRTLQKDVLSSILYSDSKEVGFTIPEQFDQAKEKTKLISAYVRLGAIDAEVRKKIALHIASVDEAVDKLKIHQKEKTINVGEINFAALEAFSRTQRVMEMSLTAEEETNRIYGQINLFLKILKEFIPEKVFFFDPGELRVTNLDNEPIDLEKLSSGEKQLLILLIETLLQKSEPYIYLTDEPELSLHIEWQRNIIPAVKRLNPLAQIIAATHSPEVASKYRNSLINMENIVYE